MANRIMRGNLQGRRAIGGMTTCHVNVKPGCRYLGTFSRCGCRAEMQVAREGTMRLKILAVSIGYCAATTTRRAHEYIVLFKAIARVSCKGQ